MKKKTEAYDALCNASKKLNEILEEDVNVSIEDDIAIIDLIGRVNSIIEDYSDKIKHR